jgi:hypothetical protein
MASYETEFLQALNMASQSASGLLRSIREPDYEEKLAMETAKRKELMELDQKYSLEQIDLSGKIAAEQQIRGIDSDQLITDKNISARAASDDKNILAGATRDDKLIANQRYMQEASFGQDEKMTKLRGTIDKENTESRITLQAGFTEERDNLLQGFNVENMNLQTKNAMELASHQGVVSAQTFKDNAEVMKFIRREDVEWMLDFETKKPLEQAKIMNEEYIDPKTGEGTGKTNGEYLISYTASTQDAMKQAQFRNLLKDSKSKPVRDYIYTDMPVLNYLFQPTPSMNAYKKKTGITDMDQQLYLQNMGFVQNLGQELTRIEALDPSRAKSLLSAASAQNSVYSGMDTNNPLVSKAIFNQQTFGAKTAISELSNALPLMSNVDTSKRTDDYDMPNSPRLLFSTKLTKRGKNKLTEYLNENENRYNDISANLLLRYQHAQNMKYNRKNNRELKKDFKQGIAIGNQMIDAAKKINADPGLIKGLEERSIVLEKYLANI